MTAVAEIDVDALPGRIDVEARHATALLVVRVALRVVGALEVVVADGVVTRDAIVSAIARDEATVARIARVRVEDAIACPPPPLPSWTVAICTRDRPASLAVALDAVLAALPRGGEVLVVDNDPPDDGTRRVAAARPVRYVVEPARGLNRARARALAEATGDVVLFTDDDARVDRGWVPALLAPFAGARVGAACGLVLPASLDTPAAEAFERTGGMARGFDHAMFEASTMPAADAGMLGAGVNLAVRRELARTTGAFVPTLDRGTPARCGGDSYALYRVLTAGHRVAYTPDALVWHEHRSSWEGVRETLHDNNAGGIAMLARCLVDDRDPEAITVAAARLWRHHLRPLAASLARRPDASPVDLRVAALRGWLTGVAAYARTRGSA